MGIQHFRWQSRNLWWTLNSNPHTVHLAVWYRFSQCRGYPDLGWCSLSSYALWPVFSSFWDLCNKDLLRSSLSFCIRQWCLCRSFCCTCFRTVWPHIWRVAICAHNFKTPSNWRLSAAVLGTLPKQFLLFWNSKCLLSSSRESSWHFYLFVYIERIYFGTLYHLQQSQSVFEGL